jgi:alpha-glucosidase
MKLIELYERHLPEGAWPSWVLSNHDQPRVATRLGPAQARLAMMLMLTLRGTPTLYQGDELGLENAMIPADEIQDPFAKAGKGQGRDGERTPMPWDGSAYSGFSTHIPWLRLGDDAALKHVEAQKEDAHSMLALTRALLKLRKQEQALSLGAWSPLYADDHILSYERVLGCKRFAILLNFTGETVLAEPPPYPAIMILSSYLDHTEKAFDISDHVILRPNEGCLFQAL